MAQGRPQSCAQCANNNNQNVPSSPQQNIGNNGPNNEAPPSGNAGQNGGNIEAPLSGGGQCRPSTQFDESNGCTRGAHFDSDRQSCVPPPPNCQVKMVQIQNLVLRTKFNKQSFWV